MRVVRGSRLQNVEEEKVYTNSPIDSCQKWMLKFDLYKQPFRLLLPDGRNEYRTFAGAILSLATICIVMAYGSNKLERLLGRDDFKIQRYVEEYLYEVKEAYNYKDNGFMIAATMTGLHDVGGPKNIPPEMGALRFYRKFYEPGSTV